MTSRSEPASARWTPRESSVFLGLAERDITPPPDIRARNWGAAPGDFADGIHRPLLAKALAFLDGSEGWRYLLSVDLGWWQSHDVFASFHEPLCRELEVDADRVLLHLVHTHAGPSVNDRDPGLPGVEDVREYGDRVLDQLVAVCAQARECASDMIITWAYGASDIAVVRDLPCGDRDVIGFNPTEKPDNTVLIGRIVGAATRETVGVIVNYACHPTVLAWENELVSPDFVGATREVVEAETGAMCLFLQGASGDLGPRHTGDTRTADRLGRALGHAALATLGAMEEPATSVVFDAVLESGAPLGVWRATYDTPPSERQWVATAVDLDVRPMLTPKEAALRWADITPRAAEERVRRAGRLALGYSDGARAAHPLFVWRIGDAVLVAQPGEAYSLLQTELRRRHPRFAVAVLNLTNGPGFMYLPPADAYDRDRYQVWQTLLARGSLERVIDAADDIIASLPPARDVVA
ncbi:hypothetical protein SCB71_19840 [Herbiconiux sp. KACC 21604]|uniref:hypothetical protein n=1 Tax=unclassified Herbiconiux TaxID=2618217 RepID=UPI001492E4D1|nr:hypothetical protein [Herbiconiux sp. SALV-R1]QJU55281.1 hypothetical protein HL652_17770 [Herbiconiux sp. SALV-R1]WPO86448.1 hypothetical protein SCB71_19840 [Herbiconiux sp. KACC 21604]